MPLKRQEKTIPELLDEAADLIESQDHLGKGQFLDDAGCRCMIGAACHVYEKTLSPWDPRPGGPGLKPQPPDTSSTGCSKAINPETGGKCYCMIGAIEYIDSGNTNPCISLADQEWLLSDASQYLIDDYFEGSEEDAFHYNDDHNRTTKDVADILHKAAADYRASRQ